MSNPELPSSESLWDEFDRSEPVPSSTETGPEYSLKTDGEDRTPGVLPEAFEDSTYLGRLDIRDPDGLAASMDTLRELRRRYGAENVMVSLTSVDPETQELGATRGMQGMWVDTAAKERVDNGGQP